MSEKQKKDFLFKYLGDKCKVDDSFVLARLSIRDRVFQLLNFSIFT